MLANIRKRWKRGRANLLHTFGQAGHKSYNMHWITIESQLRKSYQFVNLDGRVNTDTMEVPLKSLEILRKHVTVSSMCLRYDID